MKYPQPCESSQFVEWLQQISQGIIHDANQIVALLKVNGQVHMA